MEFVWNLWNVLNSYGIYGIDGSYGWKFARHRCVESHGANEVKPPWSIKKHRIKAIFTCLKYVEATSNWASGIDEWWQWWGRLALLVHVMVHLMNWLAVFVVFHTALDVQISVKYPLVIQHSELENGHRHSDFSHNGGSFHSSFKLPKATNYESKFEWP